MALSDNKTKIQTLLDAIIALPDAGGGGLPTGVSALATGTFTPSSDISAAYTITHNLGVVPNFAFLMLCDSASPTALKSSRLMHMQFYKKVANAYGIYYSMRGYIVYASSDGSITGATTSATSGSSTGAATTNTVIFTANATALLKAGYTYRWVCGVMDGIL